MFSKPKYWRKVTPILTYSIQEYFSIVPVTTQYLLQCESKQHKYLWTVIMSRGKNQSHMKWINCKPMVNPVVWSNCFCFTYDLPSFRFLFAVNLTNQIVLVFTKVPYLTVSPSIWNTSPKFPPLIEYVISLLSPSSLSVAFTCITYIPAVKFPSVRVTVIVGGVNSGALSLMSVTWTVTSLRPCRFKKS